MNDKGKRLFPLADPREFGGNYPSCGRLHYAFPKPGGMNPTSGSALTLLAVIVLGKGKYLAVNAAEP